MNATKRPAAVLLVSCLYIATGAIGFFVNLPKLIALQPDSPWIELTELLALIAGAFLLRGRNWARWLALLWMAFHVVISFPIMRQVVIHSIIFTLIGWALFRLDNRQFFHPLR